jgi:hypothetical protein
MWNLHFKFWYWIVEYINHCSWKFFQWFKVNEVKWINKKYYIIQRSEEQSNRNTTYWDLWPTGTSTGPVSISRLFNWHTTISNIYCGFVNIRWILIFMDFVEDLNQEFKYSTKFCTSDRGFVFFFNFMLHDR